MTETETKLTLTYPELAADFELYVKEHLRDNFPGIVKYCAQEILRVLRTSSVANETSLRETKTELLKQRKALLSIVDLMNGKDSLRPVHKFLEHTIERLTDIAGSINAEIYTTEDYSEKPIFSL